MKNFALAIVVIAFGALMVAGCPDGNAAKNKAGNKACSGSNAADNAGACGGNS